MQKVLLIAVAAAGFWLAGLLATGARGSGGGAGGPADDAASKPEKTATNPAESEAPGEGTKLVQPSIHLNRDALVPGAELELGIAFEIASGWHTYWKNAGDSGIPPSFEFEVSPAGAVTIGEPRWPVPQRHLSPGDILDYIYEGKPVFMFPVKVDPSLKPGTVVKIKANIDWLVCKTVCLPGKRSVEITAPVAKETSALAGLSIFKAARDRLPRAWPEPGPKAPVSADWEGTTLVIKLAEREGGVNHGRLSFIPEAGDNIAAPSELVKAGVSTKGVLRIPFEESESRKPVKGLVRGEFEAWELNIPGRH